jgi:heterodisulfide reductase subunit B
MKYAFYLGCSIRTELYNIEMSTREVMARLGVELVDVPGFSCCGYPLRSLNMPTMFYLSARNLALAESKGLDLFALCNGCHAAIQEVRHSLDKDPKLVKMLNENLAHEGLEYTGKSRVLHILEILNQDVGVEKIHSSLVHSLKGFRFAPHYGCHSFRPSIVGRPEDSEDPRILDDMIRALDAEAVYYPERLDCCGSSLGVYKIESALTIAGSKLSALKERSVDGMVLACPFCYKMYDSRQDTIKRVTGDEGIKTPVFFYTQLLGLAMGLDANKLGLQFNQSPVELAIQKMEAKWLE